jgi:hypothetical protein
MAVLGTTSLFSRRLPSAHIIEVTEETMKRGTATILTLVLSLSANGQESRKAAPDNGGQAGVVCHVKVLSDKVEDVSSLDAWKASFVKEGMTDEQKGLAVWTSVVKFRHQYVPPPFEYFYPECVQDPVKTFNVYGYGQCCCAATNVEALARAVGLKARGWGINGHDVSEVFWDGAWHLLDASLINYFPKGDGEIAGVEEIMAAVGEWYEKNPGYKGNEEKLREFQQAGGWQGWRKGPELLSRCPFYDENGFLPARTHGWYSTMQEYDGTQPNSRTGKPFLYDHGGYSQGYQVNIQLRPGERLTRNWSNKGLHVNMKEGGPCDPLGEKVGDPDGSLRYSSKYGDLSPGRVGNGTHEYDVPVTSSAYRASALLVDNLEPDRAAVLDASKPGILAIRMPSSYVYLTGRLTYRARGGITVAISDNNGLDWNEIDQGGGSQEVDLSPWVFRRYDYRLRFELRGKGAALEVLKITHDIQHSQRPLPALAQGPNTISFAAGPPEGTVTLEGSTNLDHKGKQQVYTDFRPQLEGIEGPALSVAGERGWITFPAATPGEITRLRFGGHYRVLDADDGWEFQVSFDGGRSFRTVDRAPGPTRGECKYVVCSDIPAGARAALVRYSGTRRGTTILYGFRIDADYREPHGGFRPVKITYRWEEAGTLKEHVAVARKPQETYTISCATRPVMKSIVLELAE